MDYRFHPYPKHRRKSWLPGKAGKRGKYGAVSATYNGRTYHSRAEALYAAELDGLKKAHLPSDRVVRWTSQVRVPLDVNGRHICDYYPDFVVEYADNRTQYEEVKGFATNEWKLKERLFRAIYPDRILKVIKV